MLNQVVTELWLRTSDDIRNEKEIDVDILGKIKKTQMEQTCPVK